MSVNFKIDGGELFVYLDDELYDRISRNDDQEFPFYWEPPSDNVRVINCLSNLLAEDFPEGLGFNDFYKSDNFEYLQWVGLFRKNKDLKISYSVVFEYKEWKSPFKISSIVELYEKRFKDLGYNVKVTEDEYDVSVCISESISSGVIIQTIESFSSVAKSEYMKLESEVINGTNYKLITKIFKFPEGFETICSQYVMWFGELLSSIGIEASVSAENKSGHTFLTIEPKDSTQLKEDIERALYLYLALPGSEYLPAKSDEYDIETKIAIQSLQQQVSFFEQQLEIKKSVLELQCLTNEKLKADLKAANNRTMLLESMQDSQIDILDGAISIKEYSIGPIVINPRQLLKLIGLEKMYNKRIKNDA